MNEHAENKPDEAYLHGNVCPFAPGLRSNGCCYQIGEFSSLEVFAFCSDDYENCPEYRIKPDMAINRFNGVNVLSNVM